jgi:hypothetical protein
MQQPPIIPSYTGELPSIQPNTQITYRENNTYKVDILREPEDIFIMTITLNIWHEPIADKIVHVINKLVTDRYKFGLATMLRFNFFISLFCPSEPVVYLKQALSHAQYDLAELHPLLHFKVTGNKISINPFIQETF